MPQTVLEPWAALGDVGVPLAVVIIFAYLYIKYFTGITERLQTMCERFAAIEATLDKRMADLGQQIDREGTRHDQMGQRLDNLYTVLRDRGADR